MLRSNDLDKLRIDAAREIFMSTQSLPVRREVFLEGVQVLNKGHLGG
jgi:hypothetical protein